MFLDWSLDVSWLVPGCLLTGPWMFLDWSLDVSWLSLTVTSMIPDCSLYVSWHFAGYSLNISWLFLDCSLPCSMPCSLPCSLSCSLTVPCPDPYPFPCPVPYPVPWRFPALILTLFLVCFLPFPWISPLCSQAILTTFPNCSKRFAYLFLTIPRLLCITCPWLFSAWLCIFMCSLTFLELFMAIPWIIAK